MTGTLRGRGRVPHRRQRHRLGQIGVLHDVPVDGADHAAVVQTRQQPGFVGLGIELDADVHGVAPVAGHPPVVVLGQEPMVPVPAPGEEIVEPAARQDMREIAHQGLEVVVGGDGTSARAAARGGRGAGPG